MRTSQAKPPAGVVALLLTDIEGSSQLWETAFDSMRSALVIHDELAEECFSSFDGVIVKERGEGDSLFAYFQSPLQAVRAATLFQLRLAEIAWETPSPIKVRIGIHAGDVTVRDHDLYGPNVNRCGRIRSCAHGEQIIVSELVEKMVARSATNSEIQFQPLGRVRLKDLLQPESVYQVVGPGLKTNFPALRTIDRAPNNLPIQVQTYIGRAGDVARLLEILKDRRLVTLTGAGGCGKTRLAIQVAAESLDLAQIGWSPSGIVFVDLASVGPSQVDFAIHKALSEVIGLDSEKGLVDRCHGRELLLILDNCEHVVEEAAAIAADLLHAPSVRLIATSREALQIAGELRYRVESLTLPKDDALESCLESEAVQLFVDRAQERLHTFRLNTTNASDVAAICREIDGIPLAIEHAAGQIGTISPGEMRQRLHNQLQFLRSRDRGILSRQATIRATLDWSFQMLNENEKKLLPLLSIFRGSWESKEAEVVAASCDFEPYEAQDALEGLLSKSLVSLDGEMGETRRFKLLQTIRAYGLEKLDREIGDRGLRKLFYYFSRFAETNDESTLSKWVAQEISNLEPVVAWASENEPTACFGFLYRIRDVLRRGGNAKRGAAMFRAVLDQNAGAQTIHLARTWNALGAMLWVQDLFLEAEAAYIKTFEYFQLLGETDSLVGIENNLAIINAELGRTEVAIRLFEKALAGYEAQGNGSRQAQVNSNLGLLRLNSGDTAGAIANLNRVDANLFQNPNLRATFLKTYSLALIQADRPGEARDLLRNAFEIWVEFEDVPALPGALIAAAYLGIGQRQPAKIANLLGASKTIEKETGCFISVTERQIFDAVGIRLSEELQPAKIASAMAEGERLSVQDASKISRILLSKSSET